MYHLPSILIGGFAAVAAWALVAPSAPAHDEAGSGGAQVQTSVNRAAKGDRLAAPRPRHGDESTVTTVEVVGIHDASVIYRDREGRILFQTDPVNNRTIVSKGFVLPELTVRETKRSVPVRLEVLRGPPVPAPIPEGCDAVVSRYVQPGLFQALAHQTGHCVT
jgi:hypothetical protein